MIGKQKTNIGNLAAVENEQLHNVYYKLFYFNIFGPYFFKIYMKIFIRY
jgi:hypothetical protein